MWPFKKKQKDITEPVHTLLLLLQDYLAWKVTLPIVSCCSGGKGYKISNSNVDICFDIFPAWRGSPPHMVIALPWLTKDEVQALAEVLFDWVQWYEKEQLKEQRKLFGKALGIDKC